MLELYINTIGMGFIGKKDKNIAFLRLFHFGRVWWS
jgi:hypothetical protein